MWTKYILGALAVVFFILALSRAVRGRARPQVRTWMLTAVIFAAISGYLFYQG